MYSETCLQTALTILDVISIQMLKSCVPFFKAMAVFHPEKGILQ